VPGLGRFSGQSLAHCVRHRPLALAAILELAEQKAQTLKAQAAAFRDLSSSLTYDTPAPDNA
jgi:hypothetical protein